MSSFFKCVLKITIVWCMLSEIRSVTQFSVILGHSLTLLTTRKIKTFKKWKICLKISFYTCVPQMTIVWCMVPEIWSAKDNFLSFWTIFLPIYLPNNSENQNFEKKKGKKAWRYHFTQVHHKEKLYDIYVFMIYMIYDIYVFYQIQWKWSIFLWFTMFINSTWFWLLLPFPLGITKKFPF